MSCSDASGSAIRTAGKDFMHLFKKKKNLFFPIFFLNLNPEFLSLKAEKRQRTSASDDGSSKVLRTQTRSTACKYLLCCF